MNREQLDEIRNRAGTATEGPWHRVGKSIQADVPLSDDGPSTTKWNTTVVCSVGAWGSGRPTEEDAEFIAHARQDVPALLAEIDRRPQVDVDKLRELAGALNRMQARHPHGNYVGFGDAILEAIGEEAGYLGRPLPLHELIVIHEWDELVFGGFLCLKCTPEEAYNEDPDLTVAWPCPPLRAAGMTDELARDTILIHRSVIEARARGEATLRVAAATAEGIAGGDIKGSSEGSSTGGVS